MNVGLDHCVHNVAIVVVVVVVVVMVVVEHHFLYLLAQLQFQQLLVDHRIDKIPPSCSFSFERG